MVVLHEQRGLTMPNMLRPLDRQCDLVFIQKPRTQKICRMPMIVSHERFPILLTASRTPHSCSPLRQVTALENKKGEGWGLS